jgi:protein TonB
MTDLTLAPSRFSSRRRISSGTLAAAIAVHLGVAAVIIALPPELVPVDRITRLIIKNIPAMPDPQPVVEKQKPEMAVQTHDRAPTHEKQPLAVTSILPSDGPQIGSDVIGFDPPTLPPVTSGLPVDPPAAPVMIGASIDPRFSDGFQPIYPAAMLRLGKEGSCTVRVTIDPRGRVSNVVPVRGDDPAFCAATEKQAFAKWRFRPATRDGVPIAGEKELSVRFRLDQ